MIKKYSYIILLCLLSFTSCVKEVKNVDILVEDQYRHYYPIIQGQNLSLTYRIANLGKEPLVITDILPTCGCIEVDKENNNIVPPGKYITLKFNWDSSKNIGYASESIFIYGNINTPNDSNFVELVFDTHVVPLYDSSPDYEEYYTNNKKLDDAIKGVVNGDESQRGYWINNGDYPGDYNKSYKKYPWLEDESVFNSKLKN